PHVLVLTASPIPRTPPSPPPPFFSHGYPHPRDQLSFPTRRSSDLHVAGAVGAGDRRVVDGLQEFGGGAGAAQQGEVARGRRRGQDRKSTRLNSSHVKISYAVFCLKKKNNKHVHSRPLTVPSLHASL